MHQSLSVIIWQYDVATPYPTLMECFEENGIIWGTNLARSLLMIIGGIIQSVRYPVPLRTPTLNT